jgi:hypothetical protein
METWPQLNPIPKDHSLWLEDDLYNELSERWEFNVTPFEWLWRAGEPGSSGREALSTINIDHSVPPVAKARGGRSTAVQMLQEFLSNRLYRYADDRNQVKGSSNKWTFTMVSLRPHLHNRSRSTDFDDQQLGP